MDPLIRLYDPMIGYDPDDIQKDDFIVILFRQKDQSFIPKPSI
jgi:hypothetical protein